MNKNIYILTLLFSMSFGSTINIPSDYLLIQEGIDAAIDGDTVLVHPGTYYGPIDFERKNLVLGSLFLLEPNESYISQTIIMGTDTNVSPFVQIDGISEPEVELNGFTFQDISLNTFAEGMQSYVLINIINASPKIINNRFNNFQIEGQAESAVIFCSNSSSLIANNIFSDGMIALNYELTGWILSKNSSLIIKNNLMENGYVGFSDPTGYVVSIASENIIEENIFNNVSMGYCWTCAAIVALDGSSLIIINNLILRATGDGYGAILASESQYVSHNNTLIANNGGYANLFSDGIVNNDIIINYPNGWGNPVYLDAYSTIQISYSNIEGGYEGVGNIDIDPLFNDAVNDDYFLQSESPCIDTGTADLDGDGVDDIFDYYGIAPDMGAYEHATEYDFNLGDVNFDGEINILDVVSLVAFILGEPIDEYEYIAADINEDGELNILDLVVLVNWILYGMPDNTITDIDGNIYTTIQIGEQLWMAENLKVNHYNNGDEIPTGYSNLEWSSNWDDAYAIYNDDPANAAIFGNLYNWYAVDDYRGICPENFHIPSDDEWHVVLEYLGGSPPGSGENWLIAGGKMKNIGTIEAGDGWWYANAGANNESGFTAIPGGFRLDDGQYLESGYYSIYWSSTAEYYSDIFFIWYLLHDESRLNRGLFSSQVGLSVRCLAD